MIKPLTVVAILLVLFGIAFLGRGITGMYFVDFKLPPCDSDKDCDNVCCKFYEADYGVCDEGDKCKAIWDLTKEEYVRMSNLKVDESVMLKKFNAVVKAHREAPAQKTHFNSIIVGLVLLLLATIGMLIRHDVHKPKK